ncbi:hypothetical protein J6Z19_10130 [bacterium]|nr:hypothetical protein [bacterium]
MGLLCAIAFSSILESLDSDRKWKKVKNDLSKELSTISPCRIRVFSNSSEWIETIKELTKEGTHTQSNASLDCCTRSKAQKNHNDIWNYINYCCQDNNTTFRHIVRIRKNNFENLLDRILSGSANCNSYFGFYDLDQSFSFPTFGIIDEKYVSTRSPYQEGETPKYMIIENKELVEYYSRYFSELWHNAQKIDNVAILEKFYNKFKPEYNKNEIESIENKIEQIKKQGIIDDI